jgi:hypothetical protein
MLQVCSRSLTTRNESLPRACGVSTVRFVTLYMPDLHSVPLTEKHCHILRIDQRHHLRCISRRNHRPARVNNRLQLKFQMFLQKSNMSQYLAQRCLQASIMQREKSPCCWISNYICYAGCTLYFRVENRIVFLTLVISLMTRICFIAT